MYLIDSIANLMGKRLIDVSIPFELCEDDTYPEYYDSIDHGERINAVFFFLEKTIAQGNESVACPWVTEAGLNSGSSQADVRSIYGELLGSSLKIQKGYAGGYTGWWDNFLVSWGTLHVTYSSDLQSVTMVVCGSGKKENIVT